MILSGDRVAGTFEPSFQPMKPSEAVMTVLKIVFAGPEQLDRYAYLVGNRRDFKHVIVGETVPKVAASAAKMDDEGAFGNIKKLGNRLPPRLRRLTGGPHCEFSIMEMNEEVLQPHGSMSEEQIHVGCFHDFGGRMQSHSCVAIGAQCDGGGIFQEFSRPSQEAFAVTLRRGGLVPDDREIVTGGIGLPPTIGETAQEAVQSRWLILRRMLLRSPIRLG